MQRTVSQTPNAEKALNDLSVLAAGFVRGCRNPKRKQHILETIRKANQALRTGEAMQNSLQIPTDPEQLIRAYLDANGDWRSLVAAINRMALEGATRRQQ
ncbi:MULTISPECIES: hypothetical protein [Thalassospira]|uniref:Uncharacterized protein n=1 Tax=Thalassospira alkalitolerans TaxID=1293890 RepID=A0A1Y2LFA6_9PROT|nr:hypothetical protein [Thalassospira alkalitolerans]OSQ49640.1 hypothetical protein TALK_04795 [Thalassospira alkalitolerans]